MAIRTRLAGLLLALCCIIPAQARLDSVPTLKVKDFSLAPIGRLMFDGAVFAPESDGLKSGVSIPEFRLGAKVGYKNWKATVELGYSYGKVSMKDVFIQYDFNKSNFIRGGYFIHNFGLNAATGSFTRPTGETPETDDFFQVGTRNFGIMYVHSHKDFFAAVSAITSNKAATAPVNEQGKSNYGGITRLLYRPLREPGLIAQVGWSGFLQSAFHNRTADGGVLGGFFNYTVNYPTRVCQKELIGATVNDARSSFRMSPEWLLAYGRLATEGQYYWMTNARTKGHDSYQAQGVYALLRGILIGEDYTYNGAVGGLNYPKAGSLELILGYNYTDGNDLKAGIRAGMTNDVSANFNYYVNKFITARLGWRYVNVKNSDVQPNSHTNLIQARIQIIF